MWSWHCAHWICTPRKFFATAPAVLWALPSQRAMYPAAPFSSVRPVAVMRSWAISLYGRFDAICSLSQR